MVKPTPVVYDDYQSGNASAKRNTGDSAGSTLGTSMSSSATSRNGRNVDQEQVHMPERRPWRTGFWVRAPILALCALLTALLCGVAAIVIVKASDGTALDDWRVHGYNVQPTVLLSVLATIANALFRFAFTESARVSWWSQAQKGTTIAALHRSWDHSQSAIPLITSRHISLTAIAGFTTILLLVDGPLLQRSSTIKVITRYMDANLTIPVSPSPWVVGASGSFALGDSVSRPSLYSEVFASVLQQYNRRQPIVLSDFGCDDQCTFDIVAPGWDVYCHSWQSPYRLMSDWEAFEKEFPGVYPPGSNGTGPKTPMNYTGPKETQVMFWSNVTYGPAADDLWRTLISYETGVDPTAVVLPLPSASWSDSVVLLSSMVKSAKGGNGTLDWGYCRLEEAVQRYPVSVANKTVTLHMDSMQNNLTEYVVHRYPEENGSGNMPSTLGGIWLATMHKFAGCAKIDHGTVHTQDSTPLEYLSGLTGAISAANYYSYPQSWKDPMDDMLSMVQELSFRTAIATTSLAPPANSSAGPRQDPHPVVPTVERTFSQKVEASVAYPATVYHSNFSWLGGALAVIAIAFCAILPNLHGWWRLGRTVSMSPMEIAKAFEAPLLRQADSNSKASDIVRSLGERSIQYGASSRMQGQDRQRRHSRQGVSADLNMQEDEEKVEARRDLHFGRQGTAGPPREGETFGAAQMADTDETTSLRPRRTL